MHMFRCVCRFARRIHLTNSQSKAASLIGMHAKKNTHIQPSFCVQLYFVFTNHNAESERERESEVFFTFLFHHLWKLLFFSSTYSEMYHPQWTLFISRINSANRKSIGWQYKVCLLECISKNFGMARSWNFNVFMTNHIRIDCCVLWMCCWPRRWFIYYGCAVYLLFGIALISLSLCRSLSPALCDGIFHFIVLNQNNNNKKENPI